MVPQAARLPSHLEMLCLSKPFMQKHLQVFPAFVFSRESFSSFKRLGNMLLPKCICDAAGFTFLCAISCKRSSVFLSKFSRVVLAERSLLWARHGCTIPGVLLETRGRKARTSSSTQRWARSTFPVLSLHSGEVQLPPHFAALCAHLISLILLLTSPISQP